ncbi:MAG: VWA domain-containing protein [Verrucomicrobia bacterium]|nr:VWA domain-containing protein [Verrucomicrobiota bacterium]
MRFGNPQRLWLLLFFLPPVALFLWWAWRNRNELIAQFVRARLLAQLTVGVSRTRQKIRMLLIVAAVACLIIALARPQWGFTWEEAKQRGHDILVALDTSRSMLAEDVAPNRLTRAKLAALDLARRAATDRLGLIAFAGTAFLQCPLTLDEDAFRQSLDAIQVGIIPQGGTAIAEAIDTAAQTFLQNKDNDKALVLFTDGEDHDSGALDAARKAAQIGVRIFTIGVGTPEGQLLRQRDASGQLNYIKDADGNVVKSHLDETLLRQIASATGGFYVRLSGANTIDLLYERGLAPLREQEIAQRLIKRYHERFQWPLGLAILLLLLEMFLPDRKLVRRPAQPVAHANIAGFEKVVALLAVLTCLATARADAPPVISAPHSPQTHRLSCPSGSFSSSGSAGEGRGEDAPVLAGIMERSAKSSWIQSAPILAAASPGTALDLYQRGRFDDARDAYEQLLKRKPDDPRLHFNAGAAAYQAGKYDDAGKEFSEALRAPDLPLQQRTYYNLGNTLYRLGEHAPELSRKSQAWEESVKSYEAALQLDPRDADAKYNLDLVKKRLEQLKQQQSQSQKSQPKNPNQRQKDQSGKSQQDQKQSQKNSAQSQKSPDQAKAEQQRKEQARQSEAQKQAEAQKKRQEEQAKAANQSRDQGSEKGQSGEAASVPYGQMTPQQARQLLDAARSDEKALIFIPQNQRHPQNQPFKDW